MKNFKYSVKRVRPILYNINAHSMYDAVSYLTVDRRPSSKIICNFLLSTLPMHRSNKKSLKNTKLLTVYATTGLQKQAIIRGSRGNYGRQKSRTSHLFFIVGKVS